jgi:uncharacterized protein YndB with AHSA1/START domain
MTRFVALCLLAIASAAAPSPARKTPKPEERPMDAIIHTSARLPCTAHQAFRMFTESNLLAAWLADSADVEPKVGGRYHVFWAQTPMPNHGTLGCHITVLEPDRLLAFEWRGPDPFDDSMNKADPLTHVTVSFHACEAAAGKSCTEVHLVHSGWGHGGSWDKARDFFEHAWAGAFGALADKIGLVAR